MTKLEAHTHRDYTTSDAAGRPVTVPAGTLVTVRALSVESGARWITARATVPGAAGRLRFTVDAHNLIPA